MAHQGIEEWWKNETERCAADWERDWLAALKAGQLFKVMAAATRAPYAEGLMLLRGDAGRRDYERAAHCFFQAAWCTWDTPALRDAYPFISSKWGAEEPCRLNAWSWGHNGARFYLGMLCASGLGVPKSAEMAAFCWREGGFVMSRAARCLMRLLIVFGIVLALIGVGFVLHFVDPVSSWRELEITRHAGQAEALRQSIGAYILYNLKWTGAYVAAWAALLVVLVVSFIIYHVFKEILQNISTRLISARLISGCLAFCLLALRAWWRLRACLS